MLGYLLKIMVSGLDKASRFAAFNLQVIVNEFVIVMAAVKVAFRLSSKFHRFCTVTYCQRR